MRRGALAALAVVAAAALALAAWRLRPGGPVRVEIPERLSARQTAELLADKGVVPSAFAFRVFLKLTGFDRHLRPGAYDLRVNEPITTLTRKLTLGLTADARVTIPEGFMARQTAERLEAAGVAKADAVMALVRERSLEGRLYPSTYRFPLNYGAEKAVAAMLAEFDRQIGEAHRLYAATAPSPLPLEHALTVASIVEREAVLKSERAIIAAVYLNRLRVKMPLQADPTVQYALGRETGVWKKGLTRGDLQVDSPYNTYRRRGVPPGPICSPGIESFRAVLAPARTSALYFVADAQGGHVFSETNEQHSRARMIYKRELQKQKRLLRERERAARSARP